MTSELARMKRRFLLYAALILATGTAINGLIYHQVETQSNATKDQVKALETRITNLEQGATRAR